MSDLNRRLRSCVYGVAGMADGDGCGELAGVRGDGCGEDRDSMRIGGCSEIGAGRCRGFRRASCLMI